MEHTALRQMAQQWCQIDNTSAHQKLLTHWIQTESWDDLRECFGERLQFGTAGLRGTVGPGTNRMNRGMVQQTALGIANFVAVSQLPKKVVIGFDARHDSTQFAQDTADVFAAQGFEVILFEEPVATPIVAYAVRYLNSTVGVVITASHNPAPDNGFKVYWSNGAQIIPPVDTGIASHIANVANEVVWESTPTKQHPAPPQSLFDTYFSAINTLRPHPVTGAKLVYTPMHGVGGSAVSHALNMAQHQWIVVPEQADPDGSFPTTQFPNPEEPGALDCAIRLAESEEADAILANDPDADRLAVALKDSTGNWNRLTGDQVGLLFTHYYHTVSTIHPDALIANTIVSSSMLKHMAADIGCQYTQTLTGFKWLANAGLAHLALTGQKLLLGYEEALGYSLGGLVQDKDGVSALLIMADLISFYKTKEQTLFDVLDEIALRYGLSLSTQHSIKRSGINGKSEIEGMMNTLRSNPPTHIAGSHVERLEDYQTLKATEDGVEMDIVNMPQSNVLVYWLANRERVIVRPSGTEPKIKFYFEVICPVDDVDVMERTQTTIEHRLNELWIFVQSML